jgi:hypothetical protein
MADPPTDAPVKTPDAPLPAAQQAGANLDASTKAAAEVYSAPAGTATPSDAVKPATDTSHAAADTGSSSDSIANIASQAWNSTASALTSWAKSTTDVASADFLDLTSGLFSSNASDQPVAAPPAGDQPAATPPASDHPVAVAPVSDTASAKGSSIAVKDGQVTVNNDKVTATHDADGTDVVSEKGKGEVVTRDAKNGDIHDVTADRDTTITKDHIDDKMAGMHIRRETTCPPTLPTSNQARPYRDQTASSTRPRLLAIVKVVAQQLPVPTAPSLSKARMVTLSSSTLIREMLILLRKVSRLSI